jgi:surface protein
MSDFLSHWDTTKTSTGSSNSDQIHLPLVSSGTYDFVVQWGDGNNDHITVWNQAETTHTYASGGAYDLIITGTCTGWRFNNTGDRLKILNISQWGTFKFGNTGAYFYGCENLTATATDVPDLTGTASLNQCFRNCYVFNSDLSAWDVSAVTNMTYMFYGCSVFNSDLSAWDVHAVTSMSNMFTGSGLSVLNYSKALLAWSALPLHASVTLSTGPKYYAGTPASARASIIANHGWTITDGGLSTDYSPFQGNPMMMSAP